MTNLLCIADIFVLIKDNEQAEHIKVQLEKLNFTIEYNKYSELPFLDIIVNNSKDKLKLKVHHKPTSEDTCLNGESAFCTCEKFKLKKKDFL